MHKPTESIVANAPRSAKADLFVKKVLVLCLARQVLESATTSVWIPNLTEPIVVLAARLVRRAKSAPKVSVLCRVKQA